jgi:hypothetical protein
MKSAAKRSCPSRLIFRRRKNNSLRSRQNKRGYATPNAKSRRVDRDSAGAPHRHSMRRSSTLPWRGRVGSYEAQRNVRRGGVIFHHGDCPSRETVTPTRRSPDDAMHRRLRVDPPPPGEGKNRSALSPRSRAALPSVAASQRRHPSAHQRRSPAHIRSRAGRARPHRSRSPRPLPQRPCRDRAPAR